MARTIKTISPSSKTVLLRKTVILLSLGLVLIATIDHLLLETFASINSAAIWAFIVTLSIFGVTHVFHFRWLDKTEIMPLLVYHALLAIFLMFVAPPGSFYIFAWFGLALYANNEFGPKGTALSLALMVGTVLSSYILPDRPPLESQAVVNNIGALILIGIGTFYTTAMTRANRQDRTVLMTSIDKAQLERQRLLMLINSMGDGFIATDENGDIRLYNGAALDIIDTNETLDDRNIEEILSLHDEEDQVVDYIGEVREADRNIQRRDLHIKFGEHDVKNVFTNITPIKLSFRNNSERGFIVIIRDITKIKSLEEERDEFISVVSHELRTPITISEGNISNALMMAKKSDVDESVEKSLNVAHDQVIFLAGMINDLSLLSRAERGVLSDEINEFTAKEVMEALGDTYRSDAADKGLQLIVTEPEQEFNIATNKLYLMEVLQNFVTNSIKYTQEGSITISVRYNPAKDSVTFIVVDTGIGISKSDQRKIFDKFFRSEDYRTRESSGTGLGLFITAKLADKINAHIDVDSEVDQGSTFSITIPRVLKPADDGSA